MKLEIEKSNKNELKRNLKQEGKSDKEAEDESERSLEIRRVLWILWKSVKERV